MKKWKKYASHQAKISKVYTVFKEKVDIERTERGFTSFINGIQRLKRSKLNNTKADAYYF